MSHPFGQYTLTATPEALGARFKTMVPEWYRQRYNACPAQLLPVVLSEQPGGLSYFYWGLSPERSRNKTVSEKIYCRKAEDLLIKPLYKKVIRTHRCLIPADGFYLWKPLTKKTSVPYRVTIPAFGLFGFAGLWEEFEDEKGEVRHTFTIITVAATGKVSELHERIPLILPPALEEVWLSPSSGEDDIRVILETTTDWEPEVYSVSPAIEDAGLDLPSMILPAPASDQFGNLTLFG